MFGIVVVVATGKEGLGMRDFVWYGIVGLGRVVVAATGNGGGGIKAGLVSVKVVVVFIGGIGGGIKGVALGIEVVDAIGRAGAGCGTKDFWS